MTIRFGDKWAFLRPGQKVVLHPADYEAIVEKIVICGFKDIPDDALELEHDPHCTNRENLKNKMFLLYPEFAINGENSVVTVIYFRIL